MSGTGGYLNEHGKLNTPRLQLVLNELGGFERDQFEHEVADFGGGGGGRKGGRRGAEVAAEKARQRGQLGALPARAIHLLYSRRD